MGRKNWYDWGVLGVVSCDVLVACRDRFNDRIDESQDSQPYPSEKKDRTTSRTRKSMSQPTLMMRVYKRLKGEGRWEEAEPIRNELANDARARGFKKEAAQDWTYAELAKRFPPLDGSQPEGLPVEEGKKDEREPKREEERKDGGDAASFSSSGDVAPFPQKSSRETEFSVVGLSEIPGNWGDLPSNAPLSSEVSWVQANRLRCVRETSERVIVDLTKALSPAPSYAALGWLETSIKTYAKFVDVAAKATSSQDGEQADVRREIQSIEEVRRLLAQMLE